MPKQCCQTRCTVSRQETEQIPRARKILNFRRRISAHDGSLARSLKWKNIFATTSVVRVSALSLYQGFHPSYHWGEDVWHHAVGFLPDYQAIDSAIDEVTKATLHTSEKPTSQFSPKNQIKYRGGDDRISSSAALPRRVFACSAPSLRRWKTESK